jgi:hypothetical protein
MTHTEYLLDEEFVEHMGDTLFSSDDLDREMFMTLPCPECGEDLQVKVHAMLQITRNENGYFEEIVESQWEVS